jgi:hypothetical protein
MMSQKKSPKIVNFIIPKYIIPFITLFSISKHTAETQYVAVVGKESSGEKCILRRLVAGARGLIDCI